MKDSRPWIQPIRTPKGKSLSAAQYVALVAGSVNAQPCVYGHFDCALWEHGPCENEVAAENGVDQED